MLLVLFAFFTISLTADEPAVCHPYLSEVSTLQFRSTKDLQYIELAVTEECRRDEGLMNDLKLTKYGLLVVNTKSRLMDKQGRFFTKTFADFNNLKWPKSKEDYHAFFVLGSQTGGDTTVPPGNSPRGSKTIHFNFFSLRHGSARCTRFVNWPYCDHPSDKPEEGQKTLLGYLTRSSSTRPPQVRSEDHYRDGHNAYMVLHFKGKDSLYFAKKFSYVETTTAAKQKYHEENLHVTTEDQRWLSSRVVDIVVFTPSSDVSQVLPMNRLDDVWPDASRPMTFHILPPDVLTDENSISFCESHWAVTRRTPGYDNACEGDGHLVVLDQWNRRADDPIRKPVQEPQVEAPAPSQPQPIGGGQSPHPSIPRLSPGSSAASGSRGPEPGGESPRDFDADLDVPVHATIAPAGILPSDDRYSRLEGNVAALLELVQGIQNMQKVQSEAQMALTAETRHTAAVVNTMMEELKERSQLQKAEIELHDLDLRIRYGLHRSEEEEQEFSRNLQELRIDGEQLTRKQIRELRDKTYLRYYRHPDHPNDDFIRCALCNRLEPQEFDPAVGFLACSQWQSTGERTNLLGKDHIMCIKRFHDIPASQSRTARYGISRLMFRINAHEESIEHKGHIDEFKKESARIRERTTSEDIGATVTSTLSAYMIAKKGLPFSTQFPLLVMAMRSGSIGVSAHYDPTTVRRMVHSFAVHMKYDLVKYIITANVPFSLLMDGSFSSRGLKWIVFLLRTVSPQHRPITFHLFLADVESESADHIVNALITQMDKMRSWSEGAGLTQDFKSYAMRKMLAMSSDGAAVMQGQVSGVYSKLRRMIQETTAEDEHPRNNLVLSICMAHKLNLAVADQKGKVMKLVQAVVMELYHIFGSTLRTTGRTVYKKVARKMCFPYLQMGALFKVRWSASLANSISNILRVYPVLLESLRLLQNEAQFNAQTVKRAQHAHWVLMDGRTFIALSHVNTTLHALTRLSLALQNEEALFIDYAREWTTLYYLLKEAGIAHTTELRLTGRGMLLTFDPLQGKYHRLTQSYLSKYFTPLHQREGAGPEESNWLLAYKPTEFPDYSTSYCGDSDEDAEGREDALKPKKFRNLEIVHHARQPVLQPDDPDLAYHLEDAPDFDVNELQRTTLGKEYEDSKPTGPVSETIFEFYSNVADRLQYHLGESRVHEIEASDMYALEKHIILDIIDFNGDFTNDFIFYTPPGATFFNRGCPDYMQPDDSLNHQLREDLIRGSIDALERYCNIEDLGEQMLLFYNRISRAVRRFRKWPPGLREMHGSLYFYEVLLNNTDALLIPDEVAQAIRCVLVIPASNADPERSFSAANRLSSEERSNINTDTLDYLMTVQRDGPSLLTVKPEQLAHQWMHPSPGLGLSPGKPSTYEKEGSLMKDVKTSLSTGAVDQLISLHVKRYMTLHGLNHRSDSEEIKHRLLQNERAKSSIFSIGSVPL